MDADWCAPPPSFEPVLDLIARQGLLSPSIALSASAQVAPYMPDDATVLLAHLDGDGSAANPGGPGMRVRGKVAYTANAQPATSRYRSGHPFAVAIALLYPPSLASRATEGRPFLPSQALLVRPALA